MSILRDQINAAIEELDERIDDYEEEPDDCIAEVADSHVPIYHWELLKAASEDMDLALDEPECGPAYDGSPTPINIIAANFYETLSNALYDHVQERSS